MQIFSLFGKKTWKRGIFFRVFGPSVQNLLIHQQVSLRDRDLSSGEVFQYVVYGPRDELLVSGVGHTIRRGVSRKDAKGAKDLLGFQCLTKPLASHALEAKKRSLTRSRGEREGSACVWARLEGSGRWLVLYQRPERSKNVSSGQGKNLWGVAENRRPIFVGAVC